MEKKPTSSFEWEEDPILKRTELDEEVDMSTHDGRQLAVEIQRAQVDMEKLMSPRGTLRLPPLLESRRWIVGIPDGAFRGSLAYDRIAMWQVDWGDRRRYKGTRIFMPVQGKKRETQSTPRGIIVGAGLQALDNLRSNGMDVGHVVAFSRIAPIRIPVDWIDGKDQYIAIMNVGDIVWSEDLELARRRGLVNVQAVETKDKDTGVVTTTHLYLDHNGKTWAPELPWRSPEY